MLQLDDLNLGLQESAFASLIESKCQNVFDKPSIIMLCFVIAAAGTLCTPATADVFLMSNNDQKAGNIADRKHVKAPDTAVQILK